MYVCVIGVKSIKDCYKFFHCDEQKDFAKRNFFLLNEKVFFQVESMDMLIKAQSALEERVCKRDDGTYYINITNT